MKKYSKIISIILSAGIFAGIIPQATAEGSDNLFLEDFEGYDAGIIAEAGSSAVTGIFGYIKYTLQPGDKLEIVEEAGNKYLKITTDNLQNNANWDKKSTVLVCDFGVNYKNDVYDVSFDYIGMNHSKAFHAFGELMTDESNTGGANDYNTWYDALFNLFTKGNKLTENSTSTPANGNTVINGILKSDGWNTLTQRISLGGTDIRVKISDTETGGSYELTRQKTIGGEKFNSVGSIGWNIFGDYYGSKGPETGAGVYALDNIMVKKPQLKLISTEPQDGSEGVNVDKTIKVIFDSEIADDSLNQNNFLLSDAVGAVETRIEQNESGIVEIIPINGLDYNKDYNVLVKNSVKSSEGLGIAEDYSFSFKTKSLIYTNLESGESYTEGKEFSVSSGEEDGITFEVKRTVRDGEVNVEDEIFTGNILEDIGNWTLTISAIKNGDVVETKIYTFKVVGAVAPKAENVKITSDGSLKSGTLLTASFDYFDLNDPNGDDNKGECKYQWYRATEADGEFKKIDRASELTYTLTDDDEDKYLKFGVIVVSEVAPNVELDENGNEIEYFSESFTSFFNPIASDIKLTGLAVEGEELTVDYKYYDENPEDVAEGDTEIRWYASDKEDGEYKQISEEIHGKTYKLTQKENNCWIRVGITPKNSGAGKQEKEFFSDIFMGAFAPTVTDVKLMGTFKAGGYVGVEYECSDKNNDELGEARVEWYADGNKVAEGETYKISSSDARKEIYALVIPVSKVAPYEGEGVKSEIKKISSSGGGSYVSGGNGGGSSSGGGFVVPSVTEPSKNKNEDLKENKFSDIKNHWAEEEILKMAEKGIVNGKTETEFYPDNNITRAEFATILKRAFNLSGDENEFSDCNKNDWFYDSVSAVYSNGYMKGSDGKFRPNDLITRQEMAVVLAEIARRKEMTANEVGVDFADEVQIAEWAKEDVLYVSALGILKGMENGNFAPKNNATRAQVVVVLSRLLGI